MIIILIIAFCFLLIGIYFFYKAHKQDIEVDELQQLYKSQLTQKIKSKQTELNEIIIKFNNTKEQLQKNQIQWKKRKAEELQQWLTNQRQHYRQKANKSYNYVEQQIAQINENLQFQQQQANKEKEKINQQLQKIRSSLSAGIEVRLREQQKKEKINFYKISINEADKADIQMLENLKISFHKPIVLSKLIWSQYYQKQVTELCDRVVSKKIVCGIYKITDLLTQQCYIGQSVNISDRFKEHCKCGLGIDAPASNKLYNTMQRDKIQNFTFEILEQCSREQLNQKEAFWIQMYKSNIYGLNTNKGAIK